MEIIDFTKITACGECCVGCKKKDDGLCEGCIESDGHCKEWKESKGCPIHKCAREHNVQFCGLCNEFPCERLIKKVSWNPNIVAHQKNLLEKYRIQKSKKFGGKEYFKDIFNKLPNELVNNDYYFNSDRDGDCFHESDSKLWLEGGVFQKNWNISTNHSDRLFDYFHKDILKIFEDNPLPFMEIACGPGMGLTPLILSQKPQIPCLVSDACSLLIKSWREYIDENLNQYNINLASFSVMDIPLKSESINIATSFIGISSTRSGEDGKMRALKEVYRVLKKGGYFITIENEWVDLNKINEVFNLWGRPVWKDITDSFKKTWQERFVECGFTIESCDKIINRYFTKDDNELGEQAYKLGIKISVKNTLFILRK